MGDGGVSVRPQNSKEEFVSHARSVTRVSDLDPGAASSPANRQLQAAPGKPILSRLRFKRPGATAQLTPFSPIKYQPSRLLAGFVTPRISKLGGSTRSADSSATKSNCKEVYAVK